MLENKRDRQSASHALVFLTNALSFNFAVRTLETIHSNAFLATRARESNKWRRETQDKLGTRASSTQLNSNRRRRWRTYLNVTSQASVKRQKGGVVFDLLSVKQNKS